MCAMAQNTTAHQGSGEVRRIPLLSTPLNNRRGSRRLPGTGMFHRTDHEVGLVRIDVVACRNFTEAAFGPLLGNLTLDLFVDVIALEAGAWVFLTFSFALHLRGDEHLKRYMRWRGCFLKLLAAGEVVDALVVVPLEVGLLRCV